MTQHSLKISLLLVLVVWSSVACGGGKNSGNKTKNLSSESSSSIDLYVSLDGISNANGTIKDPFLTLESARNKARNLKENSVNIWLREGKYYLTKTFELNNEDTRTKYTPLKISAYQKEKVSLVGGKVVKNWQKLTDEVILDQLPVESRQSVMVTDLTSLNIQNYGTAKGGGIELFHNGKPMIISRWPNEGFSRIKDLVEPGTQVIRNYVGSKTGAFYYDNNRSLRWVNEKDMWAHGYWFWDWSDEKQKIKSIDTANKIILLEEPYHSYGYRKNQNYYVYNLLSEIDTQGEWYLDRNSSLLYFWPVDNSKINTSVVSTLDNLVLVKNTQYISLQNISFEVSRNILAKVEGGSNNSFISCSFLNSNKDAISITDSPNSKVESSELAFLGASAIIIRGGDRQTLTAANICAVNNDIHDYGINNPSYSAGVTLSGVGNCIKNNNIYNAPHSAILFSGNDHMIEYNDIHDVVQQSNDAGAIYAGRDWTMRGNVIRYNYFHNINGFENNGAVGVYMDDEMSSSQIFGNIFDNVSLAILIGGGKYHTIENNLFINANRSILIDGRGLGWGAGNLEQLTTRLEAVPYRSSIWKNKYPMLYTINDFELRAPIGNVIKNNLFFSENWNDVKAESIEYTTIVNNYEVFDDIPNEDYSLKGIYSGYVNIPFIQIGQK